MKRLCYGWLVGLWLLSGWRALPVAAADPIVRAVLFYSPSCGHCHHVITEVLPPLVEQYGEQLQIIGINIAEAEGQALYQATITHFAIPENRRGVPTLILGETVLVGSGEIPEQLPGLIAQHLAQGGLDWPPLPGLAEALAVGTPTPTVAAPTPTVASTGTAFTTTPAPTPTTIPAIPGVVTADDDWQTRFARDPLGNGISVLVLLMMLASVLYQTLLLLRPTSLSQSMRWQGAIPALVVLGFFVAGYLAYVETQQVPAVCGPVGDCNAVQQSEFARLFGFLPIAVLGLLGYVGIGVAWGVMCYGRGVWTKLATMALIGMTWFGVLFSIYLTFLEPFVIGATCAWCLTSAVVMTLLFWLIAPQARPTIIALRK